MSEYIHLIGGEQVERAGHTMSNAAEVMKRAAESIEYSFERQQRFAEDWLIRLQGILETEQAKPQSDAVAELLKAIRSPGNGLISPLPDSAKEPV